MLKTPGLGWPVTLVTLACFYRGPGCRPPASRWGRQQFDPVRSRCGGNRCPLLFAAA